MRKMWVSISGGRTSAYMAIKLLQDYSDRFAFIFVYANTGEENEETLLFLDRIDREFNLNIVWIEAVINPEKGKGTTHKIVDFKTASRNSEPFEEMIKKYGIPNKSYPHCTRELKIQPMVHYIKSIGWHKEFRAIGIRDDEHHRIDNKAAEKRIIYPMIDFFPTDKDEVIEWFEDKHYDLQLLEHQGNCKTCWKKSDKKLVRIMREKPEHFDFFGRMERDHGLSGSNKDGTKRVFFRSNKSTLDLIDLKNALPEADNRYDSCANEECGID